MQKDGFADILEGAPNTENGAMLRSGSNFLDIAEH